MLRLRLCLLLLCPFLCSCVRMYYHQHIDPTRLMNLEIPNEMTSATSLIDMKFFDADIFNRTCIGFSTDGLHPSEFYRLKLDRKIYGSFWVYINLEPTREAARQEYQEQVTSSFVRFSRGDRIDRDFNDGEKRYVQSYVHRELADAGIPGYRFRLPSGSSEFILLNGRMVLRVTEYADVKKRGTQFLLDQLADSIEENIKKSHH